MNCPVCTNTDFDILFNIKDMKHSTTEKEFSCIKCKYCTAITIMDDGFPVNGTLYYPAEYRAFNAFKKKHRHRTHHYPFNVVKGRLAWTSLLADTRIRSVLDIGCGTGHYMASLQDRYNIDIEGIEPSEAAVEEGQKHGLCITQGTIGDFGTGKKFDLVYLLHVIEHLPQPVEDVHRIYNLINPGGKIVIATPNTTSLERYLFGKYWYGWDTPRHIHMFNPKSVRYLLEKAGFVDIRIYYEVHSLFVKSVNHIYKEKNKPMNKVVRVISSACSTTLSYMTPFIRLSGALQVIAEKPGLCSSD